MGYKIELNKEESNTLYYLIYINLLNTRSKLQELLVLKMYDYFFNTKITDGLVMELNEHELDAIYNYIKNCKYNRYSDNGNNAMKFIVSFINKIEKIL